jgi:hypothetical protein
VTAPSWSERHRDLQGDVPWLVARKGAPHGTAHFTLLDTVVLCAALVAVLLGAISGGQRLMCATHKTPAGHGALTYCPDYDPTETPR